jgi:hypothetical protein
MLSTALIHPIMPSALVCKDKALFFRFRTAVIAYQFDRLKLAIHPKLPLLSGPRPFHMNSAAHKLYLHNVLCSRRACVTVDPPTLARLHSIHLLNPNAIIQDSGNAIGEVLSIINNLNCPK